MNTDNKSKSIKHSIIEQTNSFIVLMVGVAVFVVIFCGFAIKSLISQSTYQQKVINAKQDALDVVKSNEEAIDRLKDQYVAFSTQQINVLGGNPSGTGPLDGDNPRIILDSLPSEYDFPGLSSSVEKVLLELLGDSNQVTSLGGSEDASASAGIASDGATITTAPVVPIEVPFPISVSTSLQKSKDLLLTLERSIRPFRIDTLKLSASSDGLSSDITMSTYYLPEKGLQVTTTEVE